ncbi:MAG: gluconolaconase [Chloracidobacterium sp.]|nr:gluconolaconase [Chloracidobacterium sp.]
MSQRLKITAVEPQYAISGGEIAITCEGFDAGSGGVFVGGERGRVTAASSHRILVSVPVIGETEDGQTHIHLESGGATSEPFPFYVGRLLVDGMHLVANPAVDPSDDAIILTRSGGRGQHLPATLFRLEADGYLDGFADPILNPTGIAFDREGQMFVTNRAEGEVYAVGRDGGATVYATGLGIATGIAFDGEGRMYVGDRSGTVHRILDDATSEIFTVMEASVAAYHMAFAPDGRLFLTSPGLASHDAVHAIDKEGYDEKFFTGLGRPQGLAFDKTGNLYVVGCYKGHHGIVQISPDAKSAKHFVAGNNVVGLCFTRAGALIVATRDSVYSITCETKGILLG